MRGTVLPLALLGLALAAPAEQRPPPPLEARQKGGVITIGDPFPGGGGVNPSKPGEGCSQEIWEKTGFCVIVGPMKPTRTRRSPDVGGSGSGDKADELKAAIKRAQLELQELQAKKNPSRADKKRIEALEFFIEKTSGVIGIKPPSGGSTILIPGKRDSVSGSSSSSSRNSSRNSRSEKRQSKSGSPCLVDLEKYAKELQEFLFSFPPWERARIWAQLIQGVCGIQTGPITPDPTTPGGPIVPDPVKSGAPMKPDPVTSGAPMKPGK